MPVHDPDADAPPGGVRVHASLPARERRGRIASLVSFLFHALVIYLAIRLTAVVTMPEHSPIGDAIQLVLGGGGGGGGQGGAAFAHPATPPPPVVPPTVVPPPPPPPVPTVVPPPPPTTQTPPPPAADPNSSSSVATSGTGTGSGGGNGSGRGPGTGSGIGPGSGSGTGGGAGGGRGGYPPISHQMVLPNLDAPKRLRGRSVEVTFYVDSAGQVTSFSLAPPIDDRSYAKKFDEIMRDFRFYPAKDASGKHVAGVTTMTFTF